MFKLPDFPTVDLPSVDTAKITAAVRDAAYVAIGIGATIVEQTQVRIDEVTALVNDRIDDLRSMARRAA
jgi:hypothetical protein